jgi:Ca2+-binding EF-hand superfamily protein
MSQFNLSPREVAAIKREFAVDETTIDYKRFLSFLAGPTAEVKWDLWERLRDFLHSHFIQFRPILERSAKSGIVSLSDLLAAFRTILFHLDQADLQQLRQEYGRSGVNVSLVCQGIDYEAAPAPVIQEPHPVVFQPSRPAPGDEIVVLLNAVAGVVDGLKVDLSNDFRGMDPLRQGVVPTFRFRSHLTNMGVRNVDRLVSHYQRQTGVDYRSFLEDLARYGQLDRSRQGISEESKKLLLLLKTNIVVNQTNVQDLFYRYDTRRTSRVLKSRVPGILAAMGINPSADDIAHLCDDFGDPKMPEYIAYKSLVDNVDALQIGDDELRAVEVNAEARGIDRETCALLNSFREKLIARRRSARDGFKGCRPGGITPQEFREGLLTLAFVLKEAEIQKLIRKYRCNLRSDVDWAAFCSDIEASRTLDFGSY